METGSLGVLSMTFRMKRISRNIALRLSSKQAVSVKYLGNGLSGNETISVKSSYKKTLLSEVPARRNK
jgi:hypothetical protein